MSLYDILPELHDWPEHILVGQEARAGMGAFQKKAEPCTRKMCQ